MRSLARAMRGRSWLAWVSLLFASNIAAAHPAASAPGERRDPVALLAVHPDAAPQLDPAEDQPSAGEQDDLLTGPAVAPRGTPESSVTRGRVLRMFVFVPSASIPLERLSPRAPPFSSSL
jgi:hypothetical protein